MHAVQRSLIGGAVVTLITATVLAQEASPPDLSQRQRAALQVLLAASEGDSNDLAVPEHDWPLHVLRASDGSHYVAFSVYSATALAPERPLVVYVRLATRSSTSSAVAPRERSAVAEWLAGQSATPVLPRRGIAIGQMPTFGAGGIAARGPGAETQSLQLLELERERAREKREAQERARKAALEGEDIARAQRPLLPFEDFDLDFRAIADGAGTPVLRRSFTAGPGEYELTVAWVEAGGRQPGRAYVARRVVTLPPASASGLALSSVIVADHVGVRQAAVPAVEQTAHPYAIGATDIVPARDHVLTPDERLALVVQVINARGTASGKPDVSMSYRVFRREGARERNIGTLAPQLYNELTLPFEFDVRKGHPIFAATAVPLQTFQRGEYRLEVTATDRVAGVGVATDVTFTVAATPAALLREAPPLAPAFDPQQENLPAAVPVMLGALRASGGNDREALSAWQAALDNGVAPLTLWPAMIDAHLRLGDTAAAMELARGALKAAPAHPRITQQLARALLLAGRADDALGVLENHLGTSSDDVEALWLAVHALYIGYVQNTGAGATADGRARLRELASRYVLRNGKHAALAGAWSEAVR